MRAERGRAWQKKRMPTLKEAIPFSAFTPEASSDSGFKLVWLLTSASRICCIFTVHRLDAAGGAGGGPSHTHTHQLQLTDFSSTTNQTLEVTTDE